MREQDAPEFRKKSVLLGSIIGKPLTAHTLAGSISALYRQMQEIQPEFRRVAHFLSNGSMARGVPGNTCGGGAGREEPLAFPLPLGIDVGLSSG